MALLAASSSLSCSLSLRCAQASASTPTGIHSARLAAPCTPPITPPSALPGARINVNLVGSALAGALFSALASSDSATSAQEVTNLAAAGLGLGAAASLLISPAQANAAVQEMSSLADGMAATNSDARGFLLLLVLVPAVGWVLFNILKPGLNQLDNMKTSKGIVGAVGLSAAMMLCGAQADAAAVQEVWRLGDSIEAASSDARGFLLLAALIPALGWVLFNILQPALNQFDRMKASKGVAVAVGLGAAAAFVPNLRADAVQELATVADNDSRGILLLAVLIPAVLWVLFNILQPALKQFDKTKSQK